MTGYKCGNCEFFITKGKFEAIINKIYNKAPRETEDADRNLSELNNL